MLPKTKTKQQKWKPTNKSSMIETHWAHFDSTPNDTRQLIAFVSSDV